MVAFIVWTKHHSKLAERQLESTAQLTAEKVAQYDKLEERVRVLERIVTDSGFSVAGEIDALRDTRTATPSSAQDTTRAVN